MSIFEEYGAFEGKTLLPKGANSFLLAKTPFQKGTGVQDSNRKSQKLLPLSKMVITLLNVSFLP